MPRTAKRAEPLESLQEQIGYQFREPAWLIQALTHRSHRERNGGPAATLDNERLEFLGDAVVGFVVSDVLCRLFPTLKEGKLSRIRANLVNTRHLRRVAERLQLGRYLRLGPGEEKTGGRQKQALLANAVEALVAALYRDGGLEPACRFVDEFLLRELHEGSVEPLARADYKSALQEYLQGRRWPAARYEVVETRGPEHRKMFTVELWVGDRRLARGEGLSKKAAEQQAACQGLQQLAVEAETPTL
ncbi:ribonuclease III [Acidobacteriia bacterium AH_259_A11_L15]|nr:ribonuclease III [Acidobacteriia bacterium AH_259_A11_L15]MDA2913359.1 ribonuclease III [Acidobacteriia bacterium AH_259_A11_L15]